MGQHLHPSQDCPFLSNEVLTGAQRRIFSSYGHTGSPNPSVGFGEMNPLTALPFPPDVRRDNRAAHQSEPPAYFDTPISFTLISFLCDGSSILIESLSLV